jgi:hypothetical protein
MYPMRVKDGIRCSLEDFFQYYLVFCTWSQFICIDGSGAIHEL